MIQGLLEDDLHEDIRKYIETALQLQAGVFPKLLGEFDSPAAMADAFRFSSSERQFVAEGDFSAGVNDLLLAEAVDELNEALLPFVLAAPGEVLRFVKWAEKEPKKDFDGETWDDVDDDVVRELVPAF